MRPVTPRSSRSWSGSWRVASTDHTFTDGGIAPGLLRTRAHLGHTAGQGLVGDEGVQDHPVEQAARPTASS